MNLSSPISRSDTSFVPRRIDSLLRERTSMTRKEVIECLSEGKVVVSDSLVSDPRQLVFDDKKVIVDGKKLPAKTPSVVYAFHKPSGLISAYKSEMGKPNIGSFMDQMGENLTHIGRLDKLTTGLLLITNDGDLCHALTDPSCNIEKKYLLGIQGCPKSIETKVEKLSLPIVNRKTKVEVTYNSKSVRVITSTPSETQIELILTEGKNRQIRRMCAILHLQLLHLHRYSVGSVTLGDLGPGAFRLLGPSEMDALYSPFGGIGGFETKRARQLISIFDSGGFLPDHAENVKEWKESYLV